MPNKYTYPDSEVLRNSFDLRDPIAAHTMETRLAFARVTQLIQNPVQGNFDLDHLLEINRRTLQDMYPWAGRLRDIDTGTMTTGLVHCRPQFLQAEADRIFGAIKADDYLRGMSDEQFADRLAEHWGELTALHPALDGNTRSQRVFVDQLTRAADRSIDWTAVNQNIEHFKHARLLAHAGQTGPLRDALSSVLRPGADRMDGPAVAGPAVDPAVQRAAMAGVAEPTGIRAPQEQGGKQSGGRRSGPTTPGLSKPESPER